MKPLNFHTKKIVFLVAFLGVFELSNAYPVTVASNRSCHQDSLLRKNPIDNRDGIDILFPFHSLLENQYANTSLIYTETNTSLSSGWNWWSTCIEQTGSNGLSTLENALGHSGLIIKSQEEVVTNGYSYFGYDFWFGPLKSINNEECYKIQTDATCSVTMSGVPVRPEDHPIPLRPNWTWIGYPVAYAQSVGTALSGFSPSNGDIIKGQNATSFYVSGYGWFPPNVQLSPGLGYMYKSYSDETRELTFASSDSQSGKAATAGGTSFWPYDFHRFANNLSVIATVELDGVELQSSDVTLGAFVDGECRGSGKLMLFEPLNRYYAVLTVTGQEGERIHFGAVDEKEGLPFRGSGEGVVFSADAVVGSFDDPFVVRLESSAATEESTSAQRLSLYPNPVSSATAVTVELPYGETPDKVEIYDVDGTALAHPMQLHGKFIQGLPSGLYMVKVLSKSGNLYFGKLVVM